MARALMKVVLVAVVAVAVAHAAVATSVFDTNVCDVRWYPCPRDPECDTYTLVVESMQVIADGMTSVVASELKPGTMLQVTLLGSIIDPEYQSYTTYRVYSLTGTQVATGSVNDDVLKVVGDRFSMSVNFTVTQDNIASPGWFEFGIEVAQGTSTASYQGMCIEVASAEYVKYEIAKPNPPFVCNCSIDPQTLRYIPVNAPLYGIPTPSTVCPHSKCQLQWTYQMAWQFCWQYKFSVENVMTAFRGVNRTADLAPNDLAELTVTGTTQFTSMASIPTDAVFQVFAWDSPDSSATVLLQQGLKLSSCTSQGCAFSITAGLTLPDLAFNSAEWFGLTLSVQPSTTNYELWMLVSLQNSVYTDFTRYGPLPSPGFVSLCKDEGYGKFVNQTIPLSVQDVQCSFEL